MPICKFCGLEIQWAERLGARVPLDPDFGDHRESCVGISSLNRDTIRNNNHEDRVSAFLKLSGKRQHKAMYKKQNRRHKAASPQQRAISKAFRMGTGPTPSKDDLPWDP